MKILKVLEYFFFNLKLDPFKVLLTVIYEILFLVVQFFTIKVFFLLLLNDSLIKMINYYNYVNISDNNLRYFIFFILFLINILSFHLKYKASESRRKLAVDTNKRIIISSVKKFLNEKNKDTEFTTSDIIQGSLHSSKYYESFLTIIPIFIINFVLFSYFFILLPLYAFIIFLLIIIVFVFLLIKYFIKLKKLSGQFYSLSSKNFSQEVNNFIKDNSPIGMHDFSKDNFNNFFINYDFLQLSSERIQLFSSILKILLIIFIAIFIILSNSTNNEILNLTFIAFFLFSYTANFFAHINNTFVLYPQVLTILQYLKYEK